MLCTQAPGKLRAAGLLLCLTGIAVAQNTPQNTWIRVTTVKVKPDMVQEWREIEKNEIMPAYKKANVPAYAVCQPKNVNAYLSYLKEEIKPVMQKAGVDWWLVYRDIFGAEHTQITTVRSMKNWAEIDAGPITRRLLSPPEYTRVTDKGNALIESSTIAMGHLVKDLSY